MTEMCEIVTHWNAMTITVGDMAFTTPRLWRYAEKDCSIRLEIIGEAPWQDGPKAAYQYYAARLGKGFNRRFQAANYWLWIGHRFEPRTANLLRHEGKHWRQYSDIIVKQAHDAFEHVKQAECDGLFNLIPLVICFGASPHEIKCMVGQGAWRRAAANTVSRNMRILHAMNRARRCDSDPVESFQRLLDFPTGIMRGTFAVDDDEVIAARLTHKKTARDFTATKHLVTDTKRMLGSDFNASWSLTRLIAEHNRAVRQVNKRHCSDKRFADAWTYEADGFRASLLTSKLDIATEGDVQHHCVASYAAEAASGSYAVFAIEGKERATAGVRNGRLDQVYAACNEPASDDCKAFAFLVAGEYARSLRKAA